MSQAAANTACSLLLFDLTSEVQTSSSVTGLTDVVLVTSATGDVVPEICTAGACLEFSNFFEGGVGSTVRSLLLGFSLCSHISEKKKVNLRFFYGTLFLT